MLDVLGKKLFYDTVCDNSTKPRKNEDITNNLIQVGDAMQVLYLSLKNSKNNGTEHDGKKLQSNEEFYKGAFNSCLTFEVRDSSFNPRLILKTVIQTLKEYEHSHPKAVLMIVDNKKTLLKSRAMVWKIAFADKKIYLKSFSSGYLPY